MADALLPLLSYGTDVLQYNLEEYLTLVEVI